MSHPSAALNGGFCRGDLRTAAVRRPGVDLCSCFCGVALLRKIYENWIFLSFPCFEAEKSPVDNRFGSRMPVASATSAHRSQSLRKGDLSVDESSSQGFISPLTSNSENRRHQKYFDGPHWATLRRRNDKWYNGWNWMKWMPLLQSESQHDFSMHMLPAK